MKEYFVMVVDGKSVGQQMANFAKRAEFLFHNKHGIKATALTMYEFSKMLEKQKLTSV